MKIDREKITITGHRGAAGLAPENTLSAIYEGMKYADRIEIDVHQSLDGEIIVMHDSTIDRTTNHSGKIKNLTWNEISKLDAGSWFSEKYIGEKVPRLGDVIDVVCPTKILLIEIKEGEYPGIEKNIINIIKNKHAIDKIIIQSFNTQILSKIHELEPKIKLHKLFIKSFSFFGIKIIIGSVVHFFNFKKHYYIDEYSIYHKFLLKPFIQHLDKRTNYRMINVWIENSVKNAQRLKNIGVDGFITDYPNKLKNHL